MGSQAGHDRGTLCAMSDEEGNLVRTREVLERTGISRQVLYRYMQLDLIVPARSTPSGRNFFSPKVFTILDLIERRKSRGYTLRDIRDIVGKKMASVQRGEDEDDLDAAPDERAPEESPEE